VNSLQLSFTMKPHLSDAFLTACLKILAAKRQKHARQRFVKAAGPGGGRGRECLARGDEPRTNRMGKADVGWRGLACCMVICS
jgi:hypothetical protein